mmetsp:Transcript_83336/g.131579  ORF Transcript_83336/g.131579 Transcript_83336/m.131579 type:complete len:610 (+) Transcript_83336:60-1889(+)
MVELKLESIEEQNMPRDCFISVRVGDTQKLSRLAATRVYKFPQAGDRRYGKIEVFRRIGACSVDIDPSNINLREINVDCKEAGFGSLGLRINVEGDEAVKKKLEDMAPEGKKVGTKVRAAKDYLSKHGLEVRLSEAMQAVLRDRPENPTEYLAMKLLGLTLGDKMPLQPVSGDSVMREQKEDEPSRQPEPSSKTESAKSSLPVKVAPPVSMLPFGNVYYKPNLVSIDQKAWAKIHGAFSQPARQMETDRKAQAPIGFAFTDFRLLPSVGTWCPPRTVSAPSRTTSSFQPPRESANVTSILPVEAPSSASEKMYQESPTTQRQGAQGIDTEAVRKKACECLVNACLNGDLRKSVVDLASEREKGYSVQEQADRIASTSTADLEAAIIGLPADQRRRLLEAAGRRLREETTQALLSANTDGTLQSAIRDIAAGTRIAPDEANWRLKPSIGSWCTPLFVPPAITPSKEGRTPQLQQCEPPTDLIQKYMQAPSTLLRVRALAEAANAAASTDLLFAAGLAKAAVEAAANSASARERATSAMNPWVATGLAMMAVSAAEVRSPAAAGLIIAAADVALEIAEEDPSCKFYHKPSVASWLRLRQGKNSDWRQAGGQ